MFWWAFFKCQTTFALTTVVTPVIMSGPHEGKIFLTDALDATALTPTSFNTPAFWMVVGLGSGLV